MCQLTQDTAHCHPFMSSIYCCSISGIFPLIFNINPKSSRRGKNLSLFLCTEKKVCQKTAPAMSIHTRPGSNFTEIFSKWLLSAVRTGLAPAGTFAVQSTVLDTINKTQKSFWINLRLQFEPSSVHTQVHEKHRAITLWHSELAGLAAALSMPEHNPFNHVQRVLSSPFIFFLVFPLVYILLW